MCLVRSGVDHQSGILSQELITLTDSYNKKSLSD